MALSSRIQNLRRSPSISRDTFHGVVSQMMGKKGVTDSVEKALKKTGHYYGSKKLNRGQFEKAVRDVSGHLEKEGIKGNRFTKDIKKSMRSKKGFIRGSEAEKVFSKDIRQQMTADESTEIDPGIKNRLRTKLMQGKKLTSRDLEGVPEEELDKLKNMTEALKHIHQRERAEEIEDEAKKQKEQTDESKTHEKTQVSASAREDKKEQEGQANQKSASSSGSGGQSTVPIQGGFSGQASPEQKENLEHFSAKIEANLPSKKDSSKKESSDIPTEKKEYSDENTDSDELSDMEIG